MNWLNYHHLFYFYTIAKEGSVAQAAVRLRIGQPALSTQLKQLENSLGYPLFDRRGRRLFLTERGKTVFEYASEIFRLGSEMLEAAKDQLAEKSIHLQIGAADSVPKAEIHRLVETALRTDECYVSVLEGEGERLFRELRAHRLDLVLTNSPPALGAKSQLYSRKVNEMKVLICGSPKFKKIRKDFPASLRHCPFVLPTSHSKLRRDVDHYFQIQDICVQSIAETQDIEVQKLLAISGLALVPVALPAVERELQDGKLIEIGELEQVSEQLWLTSASRRVQNPLAAKLMKSFH